MKPLPELEQAKRSKAAQQLRLSLLVGRYASAHRPGVADVLYWACVDYLKAEKRLARAEASCRSSRNARGAA